MHVAAINKNAVVEALEKDGIALVPGLVPPDALSAMQAVYRRILSHMSWNTTRGYHQSDLHRRMVDDILTLDPAFQELGLHPQVQEILREYLGPRYVLTEVKGWETVIAKRDFHGWHNDAWYDHRLPEVPREVKLGLYLTDVETGFFSYIKGTHVNNRHRHWNDRQVAELRDRVENMKGPAGTTFLFDTAGIHRQSAPVLSPRWAAFYNYHDPQVPLQEIDVAAYRYHPLILNAAFLGDLSSEERRILGFGNLSYYQPEHPLEVRHPLLQNAATRAYRGLLAAESLLHEARTAWAYLRRKIRRG